MYRTLADVPNYTFAPGLQVRVTCNRSTMHAKVGEVGTLMHAGSPEYPGWIVRFKGWNHPFTRYWILTFFGVGWLHSWRREEHLFEHQLELIN